MALTALPHGLKLPRWRIFSITRSTFVGSSPSSASRKNSTCGVVYGLVDSIWPYPSMPSSVTIRMTGFSPRIAHFKSVIFTLVPLAPAS